MNPTQVFDDIIPISFQNDIEHELLNTGYFPWFYNPSTVDSTKQYTYNGIGEIDSAEDSPQMYHIFINKETGLQPSPYFHLVKPLLYFLEQATDLSIKDIVRIKANLLLPYKNKSVTHHPHIDLEIPNTKTLIYYVKDSDGDTVTYNEYFNDAKQKSFTVENKFTPKKGTAILLDTMRFHASSLPLIHENRCVINFVFKI